MSQESFTQGATRTRARSGSADGGSPLTVAITVPAVLRMSTELSRWCLPMMAFRTRSSSPRRSWAAWWRHSWCSGRATVCIKSPCGKARNLYFNYCSSELFSLGFYVRKTSVSVGHANDDSLRWWGSEKKLLPFVCVYYLLET